MRSPDPPSKDLAHELTSSLSALLLGLQRLRKLTAGGERERALALVDRLEATVVAAAAKLQARTGASAPPPPVADEPGQDS